MLLGIFNRSWNKGLVSEVWKTAHLAPVLKKGKDNTNPSSYCPISLLSCIGKLMEHVFTRHLTWFLETNNVFSLSQTGYHQHRSTEDQPALLTQNIENSFQEKRKLLAVFFNLSKAFDRVWKKGLRWKLLRAGVSGQMYKWISSFLYHRVARVKLDGSLRREIRLSEEVPQGSVLSPTLFLLYVNDIVNTLPPKCHIKSHCWSHEDNDIKEIEKRADLESLELRRTFKVLTQTKKIRRLPGHPLHKKLAAPTKNRLKRQSLNHLAKDLRRTHEDIPDPQINEGNHHCSREWYQDDLRATIFLEVPGLLPTEQQIPTQQMALTLEMLEEKYPQADWTHIYTDSSAEEAVRNGGSGMFVRTPTGQTVGYSNATGRKCSNFKVETSALQNAEVYIAEMNPQKTVILTDSKAALQSLTSNTPDQPIHQLLKDLQLLPHECTVILQWMPAHGGIPGNERADHLAKSGSKQLQPMSTSTYQEAKILLRNRQKSQWKRATADYNPSTDPVNRLVGHEQTAIFWLRTGHCGLRAHLKQIGIMDSALCDCKEAEQTVHHII